MPTYDFTCFLNSVETILKFRGKKIEIEKAKIYEYTYLIDLQVSLYNVLNDFGYLMFHEIEFKLLVLYLDFVFFFFFILLLEFLKPNDNSMTETRVYFIAA